MEILENIEKNENIDAVEKKGKKKNPFKIILKVLTTALLIFTILIMVFTVISVATLGRNDRNLFGFKFYIVLTDSMSLSEENKDLDVHFNAGDIVIIKNLKIEDKSKLKAGDIIAFVSENSDSYGQTITHMIREVKYNKNGTVAGYVTYGTNTGTNDEAVVTPEFVLGVYSAQLPKVGYFFNYMKTTPGYITCILVPFLLLILYNGVDVIRLFRKYKKEQTAILDQEKAEIAAERQRNEEMLRELMALKEQLESQKKESAPKEEGNADEQQSS